ncbi:O-antigen ligase family protein [Longimicrobium sp.]|uniref:O-antigen ligase family protein n=1 Tax=Longimicrobium sp. TaxID=2029185 RepID=UPI002BDAB6DD|nr:O-antigen ligase family protein [Longimicrobium sp.]HSU13291.1 O-antigen ligase family protein [Longimicrobium sp.]
MRRGRRPARTEPDPNPASAAAASPGADPLYALHPKALWAYLKTQPASFWLICFYLFLEYVRPQSIYDALVGPPWALICVILTVVAFLVLEGGQIRPRTPADAMLAVFTVIVVASSVFAWKPEASYAKLQDYFSWVLIYLLISSIVTTERRFLVFLLSFLLYSFKMSQHGTRSWAEDGFIFRDWGTTGAPGWFQNSGEFGVQMCVFLPMVIFFITALSQHWGKVTRMLMWAMAVTAVTGIVASSSRGAILGLAAVALWMLLKSRYRARALVGTVVLTLFVLYILPPEQKARLDSMGEDQTSVSRKDYWKHGREIMAENPVMGIGYANWPDWYEANYGFRALPHNIFIQAGAEMGYTGLLGLAGLIGATLVVNRKTRKIAKTLPGAGGNRFLHDSAHGLDGAMIGFLASGMFVTVLYYPFFWINLALTVALHNATLDAERRARLTAPQRKSGDAEPAPVPLLMPGPALRRGGGW